MIPDQGQNDGRGKQKKDAAAIIACAAPPQVIRLIPQEQRDAGRDEAKGGDIETGH
ncbi:MAG: hypothetical protein IOC89_15305, partial [Rhodobacter sp.]|nr:hypothetical protein [Rhodobacter sp.]